MGSFDIFPLAFSISWDQQKGKETKAELMLCFCLHHCLSTWQGLLGGESATLLMGISELPENVDFGLVFSIT